MFWDQHFKVKQLSYFWWVNFFRAQSGLRNQHFWEGIFLGIRNFLKGHNFWLVKMLKDQHFWEIEIIKTTNNVFFLVFFSLLAYIEATYNLHKPRKLKICYILHPWVAFTQRTPGDFQVQLHAVKGTHLNYDWLACVYVHGTFP